MLKKIRFYVLLAFAVIIGLCPFAVLSDEIPDTNHVDPEYDIILDEQKEDNQEDESDEYNNDHQDNMETDTLEPRFSIIPDCDEFFIFATETRNGDFIDDLTPRQVETGIADMQLLSGSDNFVIVDYDEFDPLPPKFNYQFELKVQNPYDNGVAYIAVIDRAGNVAIDSAFYQPQRIEFISGLDFGNVRVSRSFKQFVIISNSSDNPFYLEDISLKENSRFKFCEDVPLSSVLIEPGDVFPIHVEFSPIEESADNFDTDTIIINTSCLTYKKELKGRGIAPGIIVQDWDAGEIKKGKIISYINQNGKGLEISNPGSDTLIITSIENVLPPFSMSEELIGSFPISVLPGETTQLEDIYFTASDMKDHSIDVFFRSNATGWDSISTWKAKSVQGTAVLESALFGLKRVKSNNVETISITNTGNLPVEINDILINNNYGDFEIIEDNIYPHVPLTLNPSDSKSGIRVIKVPVRFIPQKTGKRKSEITVVCNNDDNIEIKNGNLIGTGFLPKLKAKGYEFLKPVRVMEKHQLFGKIVLESEALSSDLTIYKIERSGDNSEFIFNSDFPENIVINGGSSFIIDSIEFKPEKPGFRKEVFYIYSDAAPGPDNYPVVIDSVTLTGYAYDAGISVQSRDIGEVSACETKIDSFRIYNMSTIAKMNIRDIYLSNQEDFRILELPSLIKESSYENVVYQYFPTAGKYSESSVEIEYDFGDNVYTEKSSELSGFGKKYHVTLGLLLIAGLNEYEKTGVYENSFPLLIDSEELEQIEINSFNIVFEYNSNLIKLDNDTQNNIIPDNQLSELGWVLNAVEKVENSNGLAELTVSGEGNEPLKTDGPLFFPVFQLLQSDSEVEVKIKSARLGNYDRCIDLELYNGLISVVTGIEETYTREDDITICPNPIRGREFKIIINSDKFSNGIISLIDQDGVTVEGFSRKIIIPENNIIDLLLPKIPSGVYFLKVDTKDKIYTKKLIFLQ